MALSMSHPEKEKEEQLPEKKAAAAATTSSGIRLSNPHLRELDVDIFYHLGLSTALDIRAMFGDVRFVLLCGSPVRAHDMIERAAEAIGYHLPVGSAFKEIGKTERYSLFKAGCVLSCSHGMGKPSISILLHELSKLLSHAGVRDPVFIRIGTSGGLGVPGGTVIISTKTVNGALSDQFPVIILGKTVERKAQVTSELAQELYECRGDVSTVLGITMATDDFYEGQGRLDGAVCEHSLDDKMKFLRRIHERGVRNIEMESDCFAAFCTKLNIRCAVVCAAILDRLKGDQVASSPAQLAHFSNNALVVVMRYIQKQLGLPMSADPDPLILPPDPSSSHAAEAAHVSAATTNTTCEMAAATASTSVMARKKAAAGKANAK